MNDTATPLLDSVTIIQAWDIFSRDVLPTLGVEPRTWVKIRFRPTGVMIELYAQDGTSLRLPAALLAELKGATTESGQRMRKYLPVGDASLLARADNSTGIVATINPAYKDDQQANSLIYTSWGEPRTGFMFHVGENNIGRLGDLANDSIVYNTTDTKLLLLAIRDYGEAVAHNMKHLPDGGNIIRQEPGHALLINEQSGMVGYQRKDA